MGKKRRKSKHNIKHNQPKTQPKVDNDNSISTKRKNHEPLIKIIKSNIMLLGILFFVIFIAYSGLIGSEFITADDTTSIVNNPKVHDLNGSLATLELTPIYNSVFYNLA